MAITSVESYALRRAAIGLGDRLGLGLYDEGKTTPLVRGTLQMTDPDSPLYLVPKPADEKSSSQAQSPDRMARLQAVTNVATSAEA